ncbi:MAG: septum formation initiator family protein, partial [Acidobacteriota bacterium]|nr:septum formation initiator family protein [Acidobacteriota bacterium]
MAFRVVVRFPLGRRRSSDRRAAPESGGRAFVSDARAGIGSPERHGRPDPEAERNRRLRDRVLLFLLVLVFVSGTAAALFGERGYFDLRRTRVEEQSLQREVDEQLDRVRELKKQVRELKDDPTAIERIAREDLGFVREGEIHFLLPREDS